MYMQLYKKHSKCAELFYDVSNRRFIVNIRMISPNEPHAGVSNSVLD